MKMGKKHRAVHEAFLDLKRPFEPVKVYEAMCKLAKLAEEAIERGIGKLFKDGHLKNPVAKKRTSRGKRSRRGGDDLDDL